MKRSRHIFNAIGIALALMGLATSPAQISTGPIQGPNGNYYEVVYYPSETMTWDKALARAEVRTAPAGSGTGHLATITSEVEDVFIESLRQQALTAAGIDPHDSATARDMWIGGRQVANQGSVGSGWAWISGEGAIGGQSGYSNWLPGEPNDWPGAGVEDNQENHLAIGLRGTYSWNDSGGPLHGFVVEYETNPIVVAIGPEYGPTEEHGGHFYEVVIEEQPLSWQAAEFKARCKEVYGRPGHLATITTKEEDQFIDGLRKQALAAAGFDPADPGSHPSFWVGGRQKPGQSSADQAWNWINAEGAIGGTAGGSGYSNWLGGEPNDWSTAAEDGEENSLAIGLRGTFSWNDAGAALTGYVVEYEYVQGLNRNFRSTKYGGESYVRYDHEEVFSRNLAMTVESWVYREDGARTEAVVTHGRINEGFFFGFAGDKIRFSRSGGFAALSFDPVPANQWTHVAATYDGTTVRFYINGESAGARSLQNTGSSGSYRLRLGGADGGGALHFKGSLDEVRLWSTVRSQPQIASGHAVELRSGSGLEAAWANGKHETLSDLYGSVYGTAPSTSELQRAGMLPNDLVVPAAVVPPKFDGNVDLTTEYAGAEQVVIRYDDGPNFADANAYLVHTKEYLYVGIEGARLPAGGSPSLDNVLEVFVDGDGDSVAFDEESYRGQLFLNDSLCALSEVGERIFVNPITGGQTIFHDWEAGDPQSVEFQCHQGTERTHEITAARDVEFRFHRSLLGEFDLDAVDRLAIRHADHGGPNGDRWSPHGADETNPASWPRVRYHPKPGDLLPEVTVRGEVLRTGTAMGLAGIAVTLSGSTTIYATTTSSSSGEFEFARLAVGVGDTLRVWIDVPEGAVTDTPIVADTRVQPLVVGGAEVVFPGCGDYSCTYATVSFNLTLPLPAVDLTLVGSGETYPPVPLRATAGARTTGTRPIPVSVSNTHDDLEFFLLKNHCPNDPTASASCEEGVDYFRLESEVVTPAGGAPVHLLTIPEPGPGVAAMPFGRSYRLAAHDLWARPDNDPTSPTSWRYAAESVLVTEPPYELLHGLPFINIGVGHDLDDYRAAFPDQICNPLFMVGAWAYAPIYLAATGGGECVGMVVTANQFAKGKFGVGPGSSLNLLHGDVLYGNGFQYVDRMATDGNIYPFPITPARFNTSNPCAPSPINIWAKIKANHGVQFSSEFIGKLLEQFDFGEHGMVIHHADALDKLRPRPLDYQICIRDGDKGHCVQPLRVIDVVRDASGAILPNRRDIDVWDPNRPNETRTIEITIEPGQPGRYVYNGFSTPWEGNWLLVFEIDPIWDGQHHVPSIDTLGFALAKFGVNHLGELLQLLVSGDAEPMVTSPGGAVGWDGAGNFSATGTATVALPQFNWLPNDPPPLGHLPATIVHRMDAGAPVVTMHNRGESYKVHASHQGSMFQLFVEGGVAGTDDAVHLPTVDAKVEGISFTAGGSGRSVSGRIALSRDGTSYPAAIGFDAQPIPHGKGLTIRKLPGASGVELLNDTGSALAPTWKLVQPSATAGGSGPEELDLPRVNVPAGASSRVVSVDGLSFENVFIDVDHLNDGINDFSLVYVGETGQVEQMLPETETRLHIAVSGGVVSVWWDHVPGWSLAASDNLLTWTTLGNVTVQNGRASWSGQGLQEWSYFRLERSAP